MKIEEMNIKVDLDNQALKRINMLKYLLILIVILQVPSLYYSYKNKNMLVALCRNEAFKAGITFAESDKMCN